MQEEGPDSRIADLDREVIDQLAEIGAEHPFTSFTLLDDLLEELPEAMTKEEIVQLGQKIGNAVPDLQWVQRGVSRNAILRIASAAAYKRHDLVTAQNSADYLKRKGIKGVIGSLMLKKAVRKASEDIVESITDITE